MKNPHLHSKSGCTQECSIHCGYLSRSHMMRNSARKRLKWSLQHVAQAWPADKKHRCRAHKHVRQTGPRVQAVLRVQPESSPQLGHWYLEQIFLTSSPSGKNAIQFQRQATTTLFHPRCSLIPNGCPVPGGATRLLKIATQVKSSTVGT